MVNKDKLIEIAGKFRLGGEVTDIRPLGEGFINDTFLVFTREQKTPSHILQRKNHIVFPDVPAMMENIRKVTEHIKAKVPDPERQTLTVTNANDGKLYYKDSDGNFWAVCLYIGDSKNYSVADTESLARQGGIGLGEFHLLVSDFKEPLTEVLKGFHDMRFRFSQWDASVAADKAGRVSSVKEEIEWIESHREVMMVMCGKIENGVFPTRVTHNDTKISNFLFNAADGSLLCAIDLDTLMSSTILNDVGDALRSYTNTGAEDDTDLSRVGMSFDMFKAYMGGYLSKTKDILTDTETDALAFSGIYITFEQVLRFLMDYIDGDTYYKTAYPQHNLVRARAQYKLLQSMKSQLDRMNAFVNDFQKQNLVK